MAFWSFLTVLIIHICVFVSFCFAADPFVNYNFEVSYITASPLGVPQQVLFLIPQISLFFYFLFFLCFFLSLSLVLPFTTFC